MKKLICLMLCLAMVLMAASAGAIEYSLPEKWQRQVEFGNGVKGTVTANVAGDAAWVQLLMPLSGVPLEIRAIHSDDRFQYRVYAQDDEAAVGMTHLYGEGDAIYWMSELMPETILTLPTGGDLLSSLAGKTEDDNPALYSAMRNIISIPETTWEGKWLPALSSYEAAIELWLEAYASAPSVKRTENGATVLVRYDIPTESVKEQMKTLWETVLQDETLLPLLRTQMSDAQQDAYLNPNLMYYYAQVIDALPLEGSIVLEREMTAKGEAIRTEMSFPLAGDGWSQLQVSQIGTTTTLSVQGSEKSIALEVTETSATPDSASYQGKVCITPADVQAQGVAVMFAMTKIHSTSVDEDTRSHSVDTWTLKLQGEEKDGGNWLKFEPLELRGKVHMHSKSRQNNAVTLEMELSAIWPDAELSIVADLITHSKWVLDELPTQGAVNVMTMGQEEIKQVLAQWGEKSLAALFAMNEAIIVPQPVETIPTQAPASLTDIGAMPEADE